MARKTENHPNYPYNFHRGAYKIQEITHILNRKRKNYKKKMERPSRSLSF